MILPAISYVIPAYNASATLAQAVESICQGNLGPSDEIIIIDDASTDDTPRVIAQLLDKEQRVRVLRHRFNKGSAAAGRNTGIEQAASELIFCLDADNVLAPGSVPALGAFLLENSADAAAFQELRNFRYNDPPDKTTHQWVYRSGVITLADALAGSYWPGPSGNYLFTRQSWLRAGRYDEGVGGAIDSWAFGIRQLAFGTKMVVLPNSHYYHRFGYDSTYVRESASRGNSLMALRVLLAILDKIEPQDVNYIMSWRGRDGWFDRLDRRPLRLKGMPPGITGRVEYLTIEPPDTNKNVNLWSRIQWRLRRFRD